MFIDFIKYFKLVEYSRINKSELNDASLVD